MTNGQNCETLHQLVSRYPVHFVLLQHSYNLRREQEKSRSQARVTMETCPSSTLPPSGGCAVSPALPRQAPLQLSLRSLPLTRTLCQFWSAASTSLKQLPCCTSRLDLGCSFQAIFSASLSPLFSNASGISFSSVLVSCL